MALCEVFTKNYGLNSDSHTVAILPGQVIQSTKGLGILLRLSKVVARMMMGQRRSRKKARIN